MISSAFEKDGLQEQCVIMTARETFKVGFLLGKGNSEVFTDQPLAETDYLNTAAADGV